MARGETAIPYQLTDRLCQIQKPQKIGDRRPLFAKFLRQLGLGAAGGGHERAVAFGPVDRVQVLAVDVLDEGQPRLELSAAAQQILRGQATAGAPATALTSTSAAVLSPPR